MRKSILPERYSIDLESNLIQKYIKTLWGCSRKMTCELSFGGPKQLKAKGKWPITKSDIINRVDGVRAFTSVPY